MVRSSAQFGLREQSSWMSNFSLQVHDWCAACHRWDRNMEWAKPYYRHLASCFSCRCDDALSADAPVVARLTTCDFAKLPEEVVRRIYLNCSSLGDRLRGLVVCKSWQQALSGLPFDTLYMSKYYYRDRMETQCRWVVTRRPAFKSVQLSFKDEPCQRLAHAVLHSLQREALEDLSFEFAIEKLPYPTIFPNLTHLFLSDFRWDADWLGQLSYLPRLKDLRLYCETEEPQWRHFLHPPEYELPALSGLTSLDVRIPYEASLRVTLWPLLPALLSLRLVGQADFQILSAGAAEGVQASLAAGDAAGAAGQGTSALMQAPTAAAAAAAAVSQVGSVPPPAAAVPDRLGSAPLPAAATAAEVAEAPVPSQPPPPSSIHTLDLGGRTTTVDFSTLPALKRIHTWGCGTLVGASSLAGACSLHTLSMDGSDDMDGVHGGLWNPWVTELLRAAPASLQQLELRGVWGPEQTQQIGGLTQLRVLLLYEDEGAEGIPAMRVPPADGAVWQGLGALQWYCAAPLPQSLRRATQLRFLSYRTNMPTVLEVDLLEALPALEGLWVRTEAETWEQDQRIQKVLQRHLPHLDEVTMVVDDEGRFWCAVDEVLGIDSEDE